MPGADHYDMWVSLRLKATQFTKGMSQATTQSKVLQKQLVGVKQAAGRMASGMKTMGTLLLGGGFLATLRKGTNEFMAWESGLARVQTLLDDGASSFQLYGSQMHKMSKQYGLGMSTMTDGLYQAISASVDAGRATEFMHIAGRTAVGGLTDMATAVDGLTNVMNAYGLSVDEATHIGDVFAQTQKRGKTTIGQFAAVVGNAAPTAAAFGVTFEELAAALAVATKSGIDTASAMAALRQLFAQLSAPTARTRKLIGEMGIRMDSAAVRAKGFHGVLKDLQGAVAGNDAMLRQALGSIEGLNVAMTLVSETGEKDYINILEEMRTETGELGEAFGSMTDRVEFRLGRMKEAFNATAYQIGKGFFDLIGMRSGEMSDDFTHAMDEAERAIASFFADFDHYKDQAESLLKIFVAYKAAAIGSAFSAGIGGMAMTMAGTAQLGRDSTTGRYMTKGAKAAAAQATTMGKIGTFAGRATIAGATLYIAAQAVTMYVERVDQKEREKTAGQMGAVKMSDLLRGDVDTGGRTRAAAARQMQTMREQEVRRLLRITERSGLGGDVMQNLAEKRGEMTITPSVFSAKTGVQRIPYQDVVSAIASGRTLPGEQSAQGSTYDFLQTVRRRMADYDKRLSDRYSEIVDQSYAEMAAIREEELDQGMQRILADFHGVPFEADMGLQASIDLGLNIKHEVTDKGKPKDHSGSVKARIDRGEGDATISPRYRMTLVREGAGGLAVSPLEEDVTDVAMLGGGA
jgi:TP901 family phage tail tape measure protein